MNLFKTTTTSLFSLVFIVLLLAGCGFVDDSKTIDKEVTQIAKKNDCQLTAAYTVSNKKSTLVLTLKAKSENDFLPGKVLFETYEALKKKSIVCNQYSIKSNKRGLLLDQTDKEMNGVHQRKRVYQDYLNLLKQQKHELVYNLLSDHIKQSVEKDTLIKYISEVSTDFNEFDGFSTLENSSGSFVEIRFHNQKGKLSFVYSTDLSDGKIYGFHVR